MLISMLDVSYFCNDVFNLASPCAVLLYLFLRKLYPLKMLHVLWASFKFLYWRLACLSFLSAWLTCLIFLLPRPIYVFNFPGPLKKVFILPAWTVGKKSLFCQPSLFESLPSFSHAMYRLCLDPCRPVTSGLQ